ncbi:MAG: response regulator receiver protein [Anaerolinea sp.]|nr:response regulator receiver protein [Anaerolinea sp.]
MISDPDRGTAESTIRILVADHNASLRAVVCDVLAAQPGMTVVASAGDVDDAVVAAADHRPDVAVIDARLRTGGGARAARGILRMSPATRIVAFSAQEDGPTVGEMIRAGATSYLVKGSPIEDLVQTVIRASRGVSTFSAGAARVIAGNVSAELTTSEMTDEHDRRLRAEVEAALRPGSIVPVFQPIMDLETLRLAGYEALARFEVGAQRRPDLWFETAEEVGLREELELAAIRAAAHRFDDLPPDVFLSLNASPETAISEGLGEALLGLPLDRVDLEITEHAPVPDYAALSLALAPLRAAGLRLAIDDAGAGFASLRHIIRLQPDVIKLDISLTRDIDTDRARRSLAIALVSFAREMGLSIVAEGIETAAELETLRALHVRFGQGYFLGKPGPLPARAGRARSRAVGTRQEPATR